MAPIRRSIAALLLLMAPLYGCGIVLGSQGEADKAVRELGPVEERPDAPNPLVADGGTGSRPRTTQKPGQTTTTTSATTTTTTFLLGQVPRTAGTSGKPGTAGSPTTTVVRRQPPTYPPGLAERMARLRQTDRFYEEARHATFPEPVAPLTQFCSDLGAYLEAGYQTSIMMQAEPDLSSLRRSIAQLDWTLHDLVPYVPDQLPTTFTDAASTIERARPQLDAAQTVPELWALYSNLLQPFSLRIQRIFEAHQGDCPNLHHG